MVSDVQQEGATGYQCEVCELHYREHETARQCEEWCRAHGSCNLELIAQAIENQSS